MARSAPGRSRNAARSGRYIWGMDARDPTHADEEDSPLKPKPPEHPAIRPAVPEDAAAIAAIYNEGIRDRVALRT